MTHKYSDAGIQFALDNVIEEKFFLEFSNIYFLKETQDGNGQSELQVIVDAENLCIADFDNKKKCGFFRDINGMQKSSDHMIFYKQGNIWNLCIIEMKTSVGHKRWTEIKQKTRATYMNAVAIAAVLGISIHEVQVITTYENDRFSASLKTTTNPALYKPQLGLRQRDFKRDEWDKDCIYIQLAGERRLRHKKIQMIRNDSTQILEGKLEINKSPSAS